MVSELITQRSWASQAGTRRFVDRHSAGKADDAFSSLGGQLWLSSLGMGTYRGAPNDATDARYEAAIIEAVRQGINVIDTASNYRNQRSERVVGRALRRLIAMGEIYRSEVLIASKVGFVPMADQPPLDLEAWFRSHTIDRGLAEEGELNCRCHCMAPRYIAATIAQSLENMGLQTIDLYYLHNPESQLHEVDRPTFLDRIRRSFMALEAAVDAGQIRVYGVATWAGLRAARRDRDYLSLAELVRCAEDVAGKGHHFKASQAPLSLHLPEVAVLHNQTVQGRVMTLLEAAEVLGLAVFTSESLHQGRLTRKLAERHALPADAPGPAVAASRVASHAALQFARSPRGVTSALVGMSGVQHVRDNVQTLAHDRAPPAWTRAVARRPRGATIQP